MATILNLLYQMMNCKWLAQCTTINSNKSSMCNNDKTERLAAITRLLLSPTLLQPSYPSLSAGASSRAGQEGLKKDELFALKHPVGPIWQRVNGIFFFILPVQWARAVHHFGQRSDCIMLWDSMAQLFNIALIIKITENCIFIHITIFPKIIQQKQCP